MDYKKKLKEEIATFMGCYVDQVMLTWKGRISFYGILEALDLNENDEIIIPSFTCVVVPNAIIYQKLKPVYVDIEPKTFNIDVNKIEASITNNTKVILAQNTFGLSSDIDEIKRIAKKYDLYVIEDCTHGFGGSYKDRKNGTNVDAAFFSSQWNKMFSTAIGGFAVINNTQLKKRLINFEKKLITPSVKDEILLKLQLQAKNLLGYKSFYWSALKLYRYLSKKNLVIGSSSGGEINSIEMPEAYLKGLSQTQSKKGIKEVKKIDQNIKHRKAIAGYYDDLIDELGKIKIYIPDNIEHTFTKYPILVKDREYFLDMAEKNKIPVHDWFISQIHPITEDFHKWELEPNNHPISKKISEHIVNLPTDMFVNDNLMKRVVTFLRSYKDEIIDYNEI